MMASDFYRIEGDYENAINCLQRSIYYAIDKYRSIPLLVLSNTLHKSHFLNDSLTVALSGLAYSQNNLLLFYYIGNIYVTLGDLNTSLLWYEKSEKTDGGFPQSSFKKHAIICHQKLEIYLEEQRTNLKGKLDELKEYQLLSDEYISISNKINAETSSLDRKKEARKYYENFMNNSSTTICDWNSLDEKDLSLKCKNVSMHWSVYFEDKSPEDDTDNVIEVKGKPWPYGENGEYEEEDEDYDYDYDSKPFRVNVLDNQKNIDDLDEIVRDFIKIRDSKKIFYAPGKEKKKKKKDEL